MSAATPPIHEAMKDLAARLAPEQVRRIHRAIIVNLDRSRVIISDTFQPLKAVTSGRRARIAFWLALIAVC